MKAESPSPVTSTTRCQHRTAGDDNEHYTYDDDESDSGTEAQAVAESAKPGPQPVAPGKEPLPKTAEEFAAAVLDRKPN